MTSPLQHMAHASDEASREPELVSGGGWHQRQVNRTHGAQTRYGWLYVMTKNHVDPAQQTAGHVV